MNSPKLIGRKKEITLLHKLYKSQRSEFVALYGRRRVGKTFLVKEMFGNQYDFYVTGLAKGKLKRQLLNFYTSLIGFDKKAKEEEAPKSWWEAFQILIRYLENSSSERKVIFIDELPWLDTRKSDFITELEYFWNVWAYHRDDIFLIVCGSATSWMIDKLINNHGGLHNRVTARIHLQPFTLGDTAAFLQSKGSVYDAYQITQLYMAMGGIPYYLESIDVQKSVFQNIDELFFNQNGLLRNEFFNLYRSLFKKEERHIEIIETLAKKSKGMTRQELITSTKLSNGGTLTKTLLELEKCDFIQKQIPFGKGVRSSLYRLTDPYSLFYLKFIKDSKAKGTGAWMMQIDSPKWRAWSGYAFEYICFYHIENIKKQLGIAAVYTEISAWRSKTSKNAVQIDLVIDRRDRVINICEIKFSENIYTITKSYSNNLKQKLSTFKQETKTKKALFLTFITTFGVQENTHAKVLVQNEVSLEALFD